MKTLIVGTGVIGTTWGWALSEAGIDVTYLVRPGRKDHFKAGITLSVYDGRKGHKKNNVTKTALKCVETLAPSDGYELILLSVFFNKVAAALDQLVPLSGEAVFLIFGANWSGLEEIEKRLTRERYLLGFPLGGGTQQGYKYHTYLGAKIFLGEVDGKSTEKLQRVKSLFAKADIQSDIPDNIQHLIWTGHGLAVGVGASLAQTGDVDSFLSNRALMIQGYYLTREIFELCRLRGAVPSKYPDQAALFQLPPWLYAFVLPLYCNYYDPGVKRIFAHLAATADAKETGEDILETAQQLKFDMPRLTAARTYLKIV
jgi:hypothetical protein